MRTGDDGHSAVITYRIAGPPHPVQLDVYNVSGERVRQLERVPHGPGTYVCTWDGADDSGARVARGVYFVRWAAGPAQQSRKVILRID